MVNKESLKDAIQKALKSGDWLDLDAYFKAVIEGLEDFQTFYELLPSFLCQVFGYEQAGILDSVETLDNNRNTILRLLGPRSNFFFCLEKCSSSFTFYFPVSNLPLWLQRALEEQHSPVSSQSSLLNTIVGKEVFLSFCKGRLRQNAVQELELNTTEYFLFCLIANAFWKKDLPVLEGDSPVPSRAFHPALELKQFLSPRQGSGGVPSQHCLKLERWLNLYFLYMYLVYFIPRKEAICFLDGRDAYFARKYGEFFWQLFCNFYTLSEESFMTSSGSLPSKFVFCILTVAISYIRPLFVNTDRQTVYDERYLSSDKRELKLFTSDDAWNFTVRGIIEFLHLCSVQWSESQVLVDFIYLACCIFAMATPWMPIEVWLNIPSSIRLIGSNVEFSYNAANSKVSTDQSFTKNSFEGSNTIQETCAIDWSDFIRSYKDLYGALIPFIIRKAAILGAFKNSHFLLQLKSLSNSFHCRSFEEEDSLFVLIRNAYAHVSETYDQSLYSLSNAGELCAFPFFHQGIYRDLKNFQGETLKLLFESWKLLRPSSRIGIVLQNDLSFGSSSSDLRFPKEFLKEFRGLFLVLNLGNSSISTSSLVENAPTTSKNLFRYPYMGEPSNVGSKQSQTRTNEMTSVRYVKRAIKYHGDPWLAPICSYECESLVRFLYQVHLFLLSKFHIDLNFRFLASYFFLCYFVILFLVLWFVLY
ncbi:hypothetical protein Gasu2_58570 [Galdieria sulphuraria]|uniref:Sphingomyelin phosphodiesterase 4 n=1 Tax=Galdieria sulphuraria TaxID=130081 RepID=M2XR66_GALSU|nr:hypothetical protein Gasu_61980 isoform 2 [Galdieria sulphuraria]XP_005702679.1 hypothetical protein Gasu_61980 isoform 1 [Galdieria sulphuraria]EME26158.1 hypothetical protein isoform 2 [Galdieria sulphuraria]EME26159.1 hypothetical protein isoform 1 [Galdieria sulphuraria]GJD11729.1 hypothetical protein Gasu2_58570 [Galdieria sulphuraria]|eukprot:XP_005702678.1 hypothetical protein isoform 2 [Galdieria sulphuraria]